jgi:hypothetical protein
MTVFEIVCRFALASWVLSLVILTLCMIASDRALRREGNSRPAVDEVEPVVAGRAELGCLVAANDRRAA